MKVRTDFVTNSSSSSFVSFTIDSPVLAELLDEYDVDCDLTVEDGGLVQYESEDGYIDRAPKSLNDLLKIIIELIADEEGDDSDVIEEIKEQRKDIRDSVLSVDWNVEETVRGESMEYAFERMLDVDRDGVTREAVEYLAANLIARETGRDECDVSREEVEVRVRRGDISEEEALEAYERRFEEFAESVTFTQKYAYRGKGKGELVKGYDIG